MDYKNKVCIVTGSTSGIGFGIAQGLLERGAEVYVSGKTPAHMDETKEALAKYGDMVHFDLFDVRDKDVLEKYITDIGEKHGGIDYIFPNAGVAIMDSFEKLTWDEWDAVIETNYISVIATIRAAIPYLLKREGSRCIITSSMAGYCCTPFQAPYVSTKHAVLGLAECLRFEFEDDGIKFQVLCPGYVDTNLLTRCLKEGQTFTGTGVRPLDEAIVEIFEGIESDETIINITDAARGYYAALKTKPEYCDDLMRKVAATNRKMLNVKRK